MFAALEIEPKALLMLPKLHHRVTPVPLLAFCPRYGGLIAEQCIPVSFTADNTSALWVMMVNVV